LEKVIRSTLSLTIISPTTGIITGHFSFSFKNLFEKKTKRHNLNIVFLKGFWIWLIPCFTAPLLHQEWFNLEPRFHPQKKVLT
jgi:hypothetical protein